MGDIANSLLAS
ncbi:hypothetical protein ADUPG1_005813, partial [Aduncisulcus paluster]